MNKLDKAMEAEEKNPTYKPSEYNPKNPRPRVNQEDQLRDDFEKKLNMAMKNEEQNSGYKPSGKTGGVKKNQNVGRGQYNKQDFLNNLDKAMENEAKNPTNKGGSKKGYMPGGRGQYDKEAFLNNLDKAMEAEEQNSGYKPTVKKNVDPNQAFLDKLDKEIEKDKEHPYVPYKDMKNNNNMGRGGYNQDDFLQKLEKEMEKDKILHISPMNKEKRNIICHHHKIQINYSLKN